MKMPLSSYIYAAAAVVLTRTAPVTPPPAAPHRVQPSPHGPLTLRMIKPLFGSAMPDMVHLPKSYLVTGLHTVGGRTFFDGYPGPIQGRVIPVMGLIRPSTFAQRR